MVVSELAWYEVVAGALQETKWFGCGTYEVGDSMVLTSGRTTPREGRQCNWVREWHSCLEGRHWQHGGLGSSSGRLGVQGV